MFREDERTTSTKTASRGDRLVATLAHELRTPLYGISGIVDAIRSERGGELDPSLAQDLTTIDAAVREVLRIVDDQLDLARLGAGATTVRSRPFEVAALVAELRDLVAALPRAEGVELHVDEPPADLPPLTSDPGKIAQVVRNLISNAVRFTAAGHVRLHVERTTGDEVAFIVTDTGVGFAPRAGRRFGRRGRPVEVAAHGLGGAGLGLILCEEYAAALGGRLEVRSAPGEGTRAALVVPGAAALALPA